MSLFECAGPVVGFEAGVGLGGRGVRVVVAGTGGVCQWRVGRGCCGLSRWGTTSLLAAPQRICYTVC